MKDFYFLAPLWMLFLTQCLGGGVFFSQILFNETSLVLHWMQHTMHCVILSQIWWLGKLSTGTRNWCHARGMCGGIQVAAQPHNCFLPTSKPGWPKPRFQNAISSYPCDLAPGICCALLEHIGWPEESVQKRPVRSRPPSCLYLWEKRNGTWNKGSNHLVRS